jgi:hypothetical protein
VGGGVRWLALMGEQMVLLARMAEGDPVLDAELPRPDIYPDLTSPPPAAYLVPVSPGLWPRVDTWLGTHGFATLGVPHAEVTPDPADLTLGGAAAGPLYIVVSAADRSDWEG